jgi:hypothetical protein
VCTPSASATALPALVIIVSSKDGACGYACCCLPPATYGKKEQDKARQGTTQDKAKGKDKAKQKDKARQDKGKRQG